jgi:hypothetical protein
VLTIHEQTKRLMRIAQQIADQWPGFFERKGAGRGDKDTNAFMAELGQRAQEVLGGDFAEKKLCGQNNLAVDFYFPDEETIVEVALSLRNPQSEFERDILKAIMAKQQGWQVRHLVFLSKPGAKKRHEQPSSLAIQSWLKRKRHIDVHIYELSDQHSH